MKALSLSDLGLSPFIGGALWKCSEMHVNAGFKRFYCTKHCTKNKVFETLRGIKEQHGKKSGRIFSCNDLLHEAFNLTDCRFFLCVSKKSQFAVS
jgi:hypothetical protein